jgi:hypothetical protein
MKQYRCGLDQIGELEHLIVGCTSREFDGRC